MSTKIEYCHHIQSAVMDDLNNLYDLAFMLGLEVQIDSVTCSVSVVIDGYTFEIGDHFLDAITWLECYRDIGDHFLEACKFCDSNDLDLYSNYNAIDQGDLIVLSVDIDQVMDLKANQDDDDLDRSWLSANGYDYDQWFDHFADDINDDQDDQEANDIDYHIASLLANVLYKVIGSKIGFSNRQALRDLCLAYAVRYRTNQDDDDLDDLLDDLLDQEVDKDRDLLEACKVLDIASGQDIGSHYLRLDDDDLLNDSLFLYRDLDDDDLDDDDLDLAIFGQGDQDFTLDAIILEALRDANDLEALSKE